MKLKTLLLSLLVTTSLTVISFSANAGWFDSSPKTTAKKVADRLNEQLPQDVRRGEVTMLNASSEGDVVVYQVKHHKIYQDSAIIKLGSSNARKLADISVEENRISTKRALCNNSEHSQIISQGIYFRYELFDYKNQFFGEFIVNNCSENLARSDKEIQRKAKKLIESLR